MTIVTGDVLKVVAAMLWTDGNVVQNVFALKVSGAGSPFADQDILDDCEDWLDNMYLNLTASCSDDLDGNECIVYKYDVPGADWDEVGSNAFVWDPTNVTGQLPRGVAGLVRLWTTDPDVQGKKYLPGFSEGSLTDGLFVGGLLTVMLAFAADWYLPFVGATSGATLTPGVWSVVQLAFLAAVDHVAASAIPAYQRRRKRNVGI